MTTQPNIKNLNIPGEAKIILDAFLKIKYGKFTLITPEKLAIMHEGENPGPEITLEIFDWNVFTEILNKSDIGLAECYMDEKIKISSIANLIELSILNESVFKKAFMGNLTKILFYRLKHEARENSLFGSKENIREHYDLGNDFYSLWLDQSMTYSSGIFKNQAETLLQAQSNKYQSMLDLVEAKAGDHILEIGCGWGGFLEYAGKKGIKVTGITISNEQYQFAQERIKREKLEDFCSVKICDYRELEGQFDAVVSIEMIEAVGEKYWPTYFQTFKRVLKPNALFAIQSIVIQDHFFDNYKKGTDFIQQYIFPGGMLLSPKTLRALTQKEGYQFKKEISFGLDYAETLNRWNKSFQEKLNEVKALNFDDRFIRMWEFYLEYCEGAFKAKRIDVLQFAAKI